MSNTESIQKQPSANMYMKKNIGDQKNIEYCKKQ